MRWIPWKPKRDDLSIDCQSAAGCRGWCTTACGKRLDLDGNARAGFAGCSDAEPGLRRGAGPDRQREVGEACCAGRLHRAVRHGSVVADKSEPAILQSGNRQHRVTDRGRPCAAQLQPVQGRQQVLRICADPRRAGERSGERASGALRHRGVDRVGLL